MIEKRTRTSMSVVEMGRLLGLSKTEAYSDIIDDDRRVNAERMEAAFYSGRQVTPEPKIEVATGSQDDNTELLLKLLQNPEMATLLKTLAKSL